MKKNLNVISIILSVIVVIVFFCLEFLLGLEHPINKTMEIENLSEIMEEIDIERIFRDENGNEKAMGKRIYNYFDKIGLSREEVDSVVKDKSFKKIIGTYLGSMFINGVTGAEVVYPSKVSLVNFIHNNYKHFQKVSGFPKDYKQNEIEKIVDDNYSNVKYELEELAKDIKFDEIKNIDILRKIMTSNTMLIIGGLVLCIIFLIILRKSLYVWLKWVSFPTLFNGLILFVISLIGKNFINIFGDTSKFKFLLQPIIENVLQNMRLFGLIEIILAIAAFVIYIVINKSKKTIKVNEEEAN